MFTRRTALALIGFLSMQAHAVNPCDEAVEIMRNETWHIEQRSKRNGELQAMIAADDALLKTTLIPLQASAARVIAVYMARAGANRESLEAVSSAIVFIQETLLKAPGRELQMNRLKQFIQQAPALGLADQLRDFAGHVQMSPGDADQILQLANAVRLLENSLKDWQASEQEVLQGYLSENKSLVIGLYEKLGHLKERLQADIDALLQGQAVDQDRAAAADAEVARVQAKRAAEAKEIADNQAANAGSTAVHDKSQSVWKDCQGHAPVHPRPAEAI